MLRHRLSYNQSQFAQLLGVHYSTVSKWENPNTSFKPDGAALTILATLNERTKNQEIPPDVTASFVKGAAVGVGLGLLLGYLFRR